MSIIIENDESHQNNHKIELTRYAMVIEYIGSKYAGSQKQLNANTIQSELENALRILVKQDVSTVFSGRTDRGVNAKGQVVHFDLPFTIDTYRFSLALNALLPLDISIRLTKKVSPHFHSRKSAVYRWYRYTINNRRNRSVWFKDALHTHQPLNVTEINKALSLLLGKHDFSSFKKIKSANPTIECTMYYAECKENDGIIQVDLIANRFLHNMVRIIVGSIVEIGKGKYSAEHILKVLNSKDRRMAGPTVASEGLTFMLPGYNNEFELKEFGLINELNKEALAHENLFCKAS
jgi:tRNA pseudouridine38-40 synthase